MKYAAVAVVALTDRLISRCARSPSSPDPAGRHATRAGAGPRLSVGADLRPRLYRRGEDERGAHHSCRRADGPDPRLARSVAPRGVAVGPGGVYLTDFWRGTVRLLDRRTLHLATTVKLKLQRPIVTSTTRDDAFLPIEISTAGGAVWVATDRGALARIDPRLEHVTAMVSLPLDAFDGHGHGLGRRVAQREPPRGLPRQHHDQPRGGQDQDRCRQRTTRPISSSLPATNCSRSAPGRRELLPTETASPALIPH